MSQNAYEAFTQAWTKARMIRMIILTGGSIILGGQIILRMIGPGGLFFAFVLRKKIFLQH